MPAARQASIASRFSCGASAITARAARRSASSSRRGRIGAPIVQDRRRAYRRASTGMAPRELTLARSACVSIGDAPYNAHPQARQRWRRFARIRRRRKRQLDPEARAEARPLDQPDLAAHGEGEFFDDRQTKPSAAMAARDARIGLRELFEDERLLIGRHAGAGVAHVEAQTAARPRGDISITTPPVSVNFTALPARLNRICRNRPSSPMTRAGASPRTDDGDLQTLVARLGRKQFGDALASSLRDRTARTPKSTWPASSRE